MISDHGDRDVEELAGRDWLQVVQCDAYTSANRDASADACTRIHAHDNLEGGSKTKQYLP